MVEPWCTLLGAEVAGEDKVFCLNASRTSLRLGGGFVEVLEPDGAGILADAVAKRGAHLFGAGISCVDVSRFHSRMQSFTDVCSLESGQLFLKGEAVGIDGLRIVVSAHENRSKVGEIDYLYEATLLAADASKVTTRIAEVFDLDVGKFVAIESSHFGYAGVLTLFQRDRLHRFEVITPQDGGTSMARFFQKAGPSLYMAFAETSRIFEIEQRVRAAGEGVTVDRPESRSPSNPADQIWLHPSTLGGVMLGLSRPSMAWRWSGQPERVPGIDGD